MPAKKIQLERDDQDPLAREGEERGLPYLAFVRRNRRALLFGVLLTFFSSVGQTFLISLFVPDLFRAFALDSGRFGVLYAAATLGSAACLPFLGSLLDRTLPSRFAVASAAALILACLGMALAPNALALGAGLLGLRLAGQGLLSLTASTTMARAFETQRGKAIVVAGLGYPLGEALLPALVLGLIGTTGWRAAWVVIAGALAVVLVPLAVWLARELDARHGAVRAAARPVPPGPSLLRDGRFYLVLPGILFLPLVLTALFLYQLPLAEHRGWPAQTFAAALVGFAATRVATSLWAGALVDRFGALRLFPFTLLPICVGLGALSAGTTPWAAFAYLALAGASLGLASPVATALWAEVYGVQSLGAIKGTVAMASVAATAAGPLFLGTLLAAGVSFEMLLAACTALGVACVGLGFLARAVLVRRRLAHPPASGPSGGSVP